MIKEETMILQTFSNMTGILCGADNRRITSTSAGIISIGPALISIVSGENLLPVLLNGATGRYPSLFTDENGDKFDLGIVEIRNGRILPPSDIEADMARLRATVDIFNLKLEAFELRVSKLEHSFDTDSLNFLTGGKKK
jgi:hypothetical protein